MTKNCSECKVVTCLFYVGGICTNGKCEFKDKNIINQQD
ncbi:MAG: hypothetical protein PWQ96_2325 [Clostridia bacterium]|jgi:hypothetical protein|nr:hypothetical protein [Clostridiales bacterium]MDK2986681.1 hypothetical protein [Clostridia bacterium]